jgi:hypothetical protein
MPAGELDAGVTAAEIAMTLTLGMAISSSSATRAS